MSAKSETLRPRRPSEPRQRPNEVHANEETMPATARPPSSLRAEVACRIRLQIVKAVTATTKPVRIDGTARPRKSARPVGGRGEQRGEGLRAALAADRVSHPEEAGDRDRHERVADQEELVRLDAREATEIREEEDLEDRVAERVRDEHPRADPVEERAVAGQAADEEDAERVHVSFSEPAGTCDADEVVQADGADDEIGGADDERTCRCRARERDRAPLL